MKTCVGCGKHLIDHKRTPDGLGVCANCEGACWRKRRELYQSRYPGREAALGRIRARRRYEDRVRAGLCTRCGRAAATAGRCCASCAAKMRRAYDNNAKKDQVRVDYTRRTRAKSAIAQEIKMGRRHRPPHCERCGKRCKPDAHHPDYKRPLDVVFLCRKCHAQAHGRGLPERVTVLRWEE